MVELPENPTKEILSILAKVDVEFEEQLEMAKNEQNRLGLKVVPPNFELEIAAGIYRRLYNYLKETNGTF